MFSTTRSCNVTHGQECIGRAPKLQGATAADCAEHEVERSANDGCFRSHSTTVRNHTTRRVTDCCLDRSLILLSIANNRPVHIFQNVSTRPTGDEVIHAIMHVEPSRVTRSYAAAIPARMHTQRPAQHACQSVCRQQQEQRRREKSAPAAAETACRQMQRARCRSDSSRSDGG